MNCEQAVKAMEAGKAVEIYLTEQVCTTFPRENETYVLLVGYSAIQFAKTGEMVEEKTIMSLDHFKMLYRIREDFKIVNKTGS